MSKFGISNLYILEQLSKCAAWEIGVLSKSTARGLWDICQNLEYQTYSK